ncbi:MAG: hypothetical protein R3E79_13845 [Caldilineaceae bacterium]
MHHLAERYPAAVIQAPIGFLRKLIEQPDLLQDEVRRLHTKGSSPAFPQLAPRGDTPHDTVVDRMGV